MKAKFSLLALMLTFNFQLLTFNCVAQTIGADTTIQAFNMLPQINSVQDTTVTIVLPDISYKYEKILMHYSLNMPPAGWDPWDRIAYVRVFTPTDTFEIGRVMTPYSKACSWTVDVTDFRSILADTVNLNSFILFWASGNKGYLVSISFEFIGGTPHKEAYKIKNLWGNDAINRWEYGNYLDPITNHIPPKEIIIDSAADSVKVKVTTTGHGQGNSGNAAEFSNQLHSLRIDSITTISHNLWRSNCGSNPCSPQSGSWSFNRAGWCPGSDVIPWDVDITPNVIVGDTIWLEYWPQAYQNFCSPSDSNCVTAVTCSDCNYNSSGHTMPWYLMQSQIVYYKNLPFASAINEGASKSEFLLYPNPSNGKFSIELPTSFYNLPASITIIDAQGRIVFEKVSNEKTVPVNLSGYSFGIYLVKIQSENNIITKKIIVN